MIEVAENRSRLSRLFRSYGWNYLPDAILDGYLGKAYVDSEFDPHIAKLSIPEPRLSIFGGDAEHPSARTSLYPLPSGTALLFVSADWEDLSREVLGESLISFPRCAFTSERLNIARLRRLSSRVTSPFRVQKMDVRLARQLSSEQSTFSTGHVRHYGSPERFLQLGFGFCALEGQEIVSVATTFVVYRPGIEIQINTREPYQGQGLATVVAANLLVHCLEHKLDPNWDAANVKSVGLANKLGYSPQGTYSMFFYTGDRQ